jgi:hypothetical protein
MKCPRCQHENRPPGAKLCEECAAPLARACVNCGAQLSPTATFCSECAPPAGPAAPPAPQRFGAPATHTLHEEQHCIAPSDGEVLPSHDVLFTEAFFGFVAVSLSSEISAAVRTGPRLEA